MTPRSIILLCAVCLLAAGCAGETAPTLAPSPTPLPPDAPAHATDPSPTFRPGERAYLLKLVKDMMSEVMTERGGYAAVTYTEIKTACVILRRNDWELASFFADPEANERLSMIAGAASGGLKAMEQLAEEKGLAEYTVVHFCDDAEKSPSR